MEEMVTVWRRMKAEGRDGAYYEKAVVLGVQGKLHTSLVVQCLRAEFEGHLKTGKSARILTILRFLNQQVELAQDVDIMGLITLNFGQKKTTGK